jgi:hypothetical protein
MSDANKYLGASGSTGVLSVLRPSNQIIRPVFETRPRPNSAIHFDWDVPERAAPEASKGAQHV